MKIGLAIRILIEILNEEAQNKFLKSKNEKESFYEQGFMRGMSSGIRYVADLLEDLFHAEDEISEEEILEEEKQLYDDILPYCNKLEMLLEDERNLDKVINECRALLLISEKIKEPKRYEDIVNALNKIIANAHGLKSISPHL